MSLKRDSGFEWLGHIPEHWLVKPWRHVFRESSEVNGSSPVGEMLSVSGYRGVEVKAYAFETQKRSNEMLETYRVVRVGQLAVNTMWLNYAGLGFSDFEGHISPAYRSYDLIEIADRRYLHHLLRSEAYVLGYTGYLRGIRPNSLQMDRATLMAWPILLPPRDEQRRIADFLDRETEQIDALIEKQEGLVTLLRERRSAALWQGVLQQSSLDRGTNWFGFLPQGWIADKLGRHTRIVNGSTPSRTNMNYWTDGIHPWLNSSFANEDVIREADQFVTDTALAECHLPKLERGAVLVGITGQGKTRGMAAQLEMQATINQHLAAVVPDDRYWDSRYLTLLLRSAYEQLRFISDESGSTKGALTCADLHAFVVPRPLLDEQVQIAARTDSETESTDELISRAERFILLSHERRAALITAAVTGQLDVTSKEIA